MIRRLICLDDTGSKTNFVRQHGWAPEGERCHASAPFGPWCTTTLIAAIDAGGVVAAFDYPGAADGAAYRTFSEKVLLPELRRGDTLVSAIAAVAPSDCANSFRHAGYVQKN